MGRAAALEASMIGARQRALLVLQDFREKQRIMTVKMKKLHAAATAHALQEVLKAQALQETKVKALQKASVEEALNMKALEKMRNIEAGMVEKSKSAANKVVREVALRNVHNRIRHMRANIMRRMRKYEKGERDAKWQLRHLHA